MAEHYSSVGPVELKNRYTWNRWAGWTVNKSFKGLAVHLQDYVKTLQDLGAIEINYEPMDEEGVGSQFWTVRGTFGKTDEIPNAKPEAEAVWSLTGNDIENSILRLPVVRQVLDPIFAANPDEFYAIKKDILDIVAGNKKFSEASWFQALSGVTIKNGLIQFPKGVTELHIVLLALTYALMRGEDAYPLSQWVLRKSQIVEPDSTKPLPFKEANRIFTTAALIARENVPESPIPDVLLLDIQALNGFWLKRTPSREPTGNGKYQLSVEWWWTEEFDSFIYGEAIES